MKKYDVYAVIVIDSGGSTRLAMPVAHFGKKVAIIEEDMRGGTCLKTVSQDMLDMHR